MGTPETPTAVWVRWPGGKTQQVALAAGVREVKVVMEGQAK
jgi:hypothetical protein